VPAPLPIPDVEWRDGALHSRAHDDCYSSRSGARAEREHVFLRGNGFGAAGDAAPGAWRDAARPRDRHLIAELGFGAGTTFLCAWAAFRAHAPAGAQLDWVSVEGAPLDAATLRRAALADPAMADLAPLADELARAWPERVRGVHRRSFDGGRVRLTLLFGDVLELLPVVDFRADAWCLDGFAPARNEAMWSPEAIALVAAHSAPGTAFGTYSAASAVGERLAAAGFDVRRVPGANGKREMLCGTMSREPDRRCVRTLPRWFAMPCSEDASHARPVPRTAVVVGAGLAGAAAARALAERGVRVTVLDAGRAASGASAAPRAVLAPHLASWQSPQTRIVAQAFLHARATMERMGAPIDPCGLLNPVGADDEWGFEQAIADWGWPADLLRLIPAAEASALAGTPLGNADGPDGALLVANAGTTRPAETVRAALAHASIAVHEGTPIARLRPDGAGWHVDAEDGRSFAADLVVIATAGIPGGALPEMPEALASDALPSVPFDATRGQLSTIAFEGSGDLPRTVVSANGFVMPPRDGAVCAGATFERERLSVPATPHDDAINLGHVERLLPRLTAHVPERRGAWAGIRTSVHDHCPVVGPVVADGAFRTAFARLAHGPVAAQWPPAPVLPGLFVSLAHGSRGTCTAFLAGELIADMACGTPRCVPDDLLPAMLPQRFLVRDLRSGPRA
jgi:tRNA 5-methylaminomethyl-2-thiouridine biosynthesis bifunctional protein